MRNLIKKFYNICSNGQVQDNLEKLKKLTEELPPFPQKIIDDDYGYREYLMDQGTCFSWFIHRSGNNVAVHRWFNSAKTAFPKHIHQEKEWVIVYSGSMIFKMDCMSTTLKSGDSIITEPNIPHEAIFEEDCKYITVTIPPSKDYNYISSNRG